MPSLRRTCWWQHVIVQSKLSVVWEMMIFIVKPEVFLSGTHSILNGTLGKQTKI